MARLNADFFRPFVDSTLNTLRVQCKLEASSGASFIKGSRKEPEYQIAGMVGLTAEKFSANIMLCFTEVFYLKLLNKMLRSNYTALTRELEDGAAELLNIIFGNAKAILNTQGHVVQKAIPTVVSGKSLKSMHSKPDQVIVLPFHCEGHDFQIEIATDLNKEV